MLTDREKVICAFVSLQVTGFAQKIKHGQCPPIQNDTVGPCYFGCYSDTDCSANLKCCSTACGGTMCQKPCNPACNECGYGQNCQVTNGCAECVTCSSVCNMLCAIGKTCKIINGCAQCV